MKTIAIALLGLLFFLFTLTVTAQLPPNNFCHSAITVTCGIIVTGSTVNATGATGICNGVVGSPGVWYSFMGTGHVVVISTDHPATNISTRLQIWSGDCNSLTCVDAYTVGGGNGTTVAFESDPALEYFIKVIGFNSNGDFGLTVQCWSVPPNDLCGGAIMLTCGETTTGFTHGALDNDAPGFCGVTPSRGLWYSFIGTGDVIIVSTDHPATNYLGSLQIWSGGCSALNCFDGGFNGGDGNTVEISVPSIAGLEYFVYVSGLANRVGNFGLTVECVPEAPNDSCADAISVTCGQTIAGSTYNATGIDDPSSCSQDFTRGLWYSFMAIENIVTTISLDGPQTDYSASLQIFSGSCGSLTCVDFGNEGTVFSDPPLEYFVYVGGSDNDVGNFGFTVECIPVAPNDSCGGAISLICGDTIITSNDNAADFDAPSSCGVFSNREKGLWYSFVGTGDIIKISTDHPATTLDTRLQIWSGSCDSLACIGGDDNSGAGVTSEIAVPSDPTLEYFVYVDASDDDSGSFGLMADCLTVAPNDLCGGAIMLTCGETITPSIDNATNSDAPASCGGFSAVKGLWYSFMGTGEVFIISTDHPATNFDTRLQIFSGSCDSLTCIGGDDNSGAGVTSEISVASDPALEYFVYVDGGSNAVVGNFGLTIECVQAAPNESCGNAFNLPCGINILASTENVTDTDAPGSCGGFSAGPGLWYSLMGTGDVFTISTDHPLTDLNTRLQIWSGSCDFLTCIGGDDNSGAGNTSTIEFPSDPALEYFVYAEGYGNQDDYFVLSVDCLPCYGSEVTNATDHGPGSLRRAIRCTKPGDTITFSPMINGDSIKLTSRIDLDKSLTFIGNGPDNTIIDGSLFNNNSLLSTSSVDTTVFKDIIFQHGGGATFNGFGGAVLAQGHSKFLFCEFSNNQAVDGGALKISGTADIINCSFSENQCSNDGGAIDVFFGMASVMNSQFYNNFTADEGGAIACLGGVLTVINSTISGNLAANTGGGIDADNPTSNVTLYNNIVSGNTASNGGPDFSTDGQGLTDFQHTIFGDTVGIAPFPGLIVGYPDFVDTMNHDYQLSTSSIGINDGLDSLLPVDICDADGDGITTEAVDIDLTERARVSGFSVDMGCFEFYCQMLMVTTTTDSGLGSLRAAISCAQTGDTITFTPTINGDSIKLTSRIDLDKPLTFIGNGADNTIIDGSLYDDNRLISTSSGGTMVFKDITFQYGGSTTFNGSGGAMDVRSDCKFLFCKFKHNQSGIGGALSINGATADIVNCSFFENQASGQGGGINIVNSAARVMNNQFYSNATADKGGAIAVSKGTVTLVNTTLTDNQADNSGGGIHADHSLSNVTLYNTIISGNTATNAGADLSIEAVVTTDFQFMMLGDTVGVAPFIGLVVGYPDFVDTMKHDYGLLSTSIGIDDGLMSLLPQDTCDVDGDGNTVEAIDIDLAERVRVFDGSVDLGCFEFSCPGVVTNTADSGLGSLRDAISCALAGDTITFSPMINGDSIKLTSSIDLDKSLTIIGNGADSTIIDGSLYDNEGLIVTFSGDTTAFKEITFQHGGSTTFNGSGGAIRVRSHCKFLFCEFSHNQGGEGGALSIRGVTVDIINCSFFENQASGQGGAINVVNSAVRVMNNQFYSNATADKGGAIAVSKGTVALVNSTLTDNQADNSGGGIHADNSLSNVTLYNTIISGNTATNTGPDLSIEAVVTTDFQVTIIGDTVGVTPFIGLIVGYPDFVDTMNHDYRLLSTSIGIDDGLNSLLPVDTCDADGDGNTAETVDIDLVGNARVVDDSVDIGAYELGAVDCPPSLVVSGMPATGNYFAGLSITSDAIIEIPKSIIYQAGMEVLLNSNFEVQLGAEFDAVISDCP